MYWWATRPEGSRGRCGEVRCTFCWDLDAGWVVTTAMPKGCPRIRMRGALDDDVEPRVELLVAARTDLDPGRCDLLDATRHAPTEDALERDEAIAACGEEGADRRVRELRELDLDGGAAVGEGALDLLQL